MLTVNLERVNTKEKLVGLLHDMKGRCLLRAVLSRSSASLCCGGFPDLTW